MLCKHLIVTASVQGIGRIRHISVKGQNVKGLFWQTFWEAVLITTISGMLYKQAGHINFKIITTNLDQKVSRDIIQPRKLTANKFRATMTW